MEKAYKYRIYPNKKKQKEIIAKTFGCCRFIYNQYLAQRIETYEKDKRTLTYFQCANDMTLLQVITTYYNDKSVCTGMIIEKDNKSIWCTWAHIEKYQNIIQIK